MYPLQFKYYGLNLSNEDTTENVGKTFNATSKFIKSAIRRDNANVLIHCSTGNNLGALFMAAYLIKELDFTIGDALRHIKSIRPKIKPQAVLLSQLQAYETIVIAEKRRLEFQQVQDLLKIDKAKKGKVKEKTMNSAEISSR